MNDQACPICGSSNIRMRFKITASFSGVFEMVKGSQNTQAAISCDNCHAFVSDANHHWYRMVEVSEEGQEPFAYPEQTEYIYDENSRSK